MVRASPSAFERQVGSCTGRHRAVTIEGVCLAVKLPVRDIRLLAFGCSHLSVLNDITYPAQRLLLHSPDDMTQLSEFQALKALIHTNLDKYEKLLQESNTPEPFLNEARIHPVMDQGEHVADKELYVTTRDLASALDMMATMIQSPSEHLLSGSLSSYKVLSLQMATSLNLADVIKELGGPSGKPVSAEDIGAKTGLHPSRVLKVLRPLANSYIFQETTEGYFVNNRNSLHLLDEVDAKSYVQYATWAQPRVIPSVPDSWLNPELKDDFSPDNTPYLRAFGYQHKATDAFDLFQQHLPDSERDLVSACEVATVVRWKACYSTTRGLSSPRAQYASM